MTPAIEQIRIADIPDGVVDSAIDQVIRYTVGLMRCDSDGRTETSKLIGTGTLVTIDNRGSILTAEHVASQLSEGCKLDVLCSFTGKRERVQFEFYHLAIHRIAKGAEDAVGPDIALIVLPNVGIGYLKSEKLFYNINRRENEFGLTPMDKRNGFWLTCGIPGDWELKRHESDQTIVKSYQGLCGASGVSREYDVDEYDYVEVTVDYSSGNPDLPLSFGGCSGGGIWQIPLRKNTAGVIISETPILSGVVFYQTKIDGGLRLLRCHGRKTIYQMVPRFVRSKYGS